MSQGRSFSKEMPEIVVKKPNVKINPIGKLQIIYSLDNGHSKTDIARMYGVHLQTIMHIYRQKELIIREHIQELKQLKDVRCMNLDQTLLDWLKTQMSNNVIVTEENLLDKAQDMIKHLSEKFTYISDWLLDFRQRHNIIKYIPDIRYSELDIDEWRKFMANINSDELYVCGTCAISHNFFIDSFAAGEQPNDYVSIFFVAHSSGLCKKKLVIVGKEQLNEESNIASLPANYYTNNGYINQQVIANYLQKWDDELSTEERTVFLAINVPSKNSLVKLQLKNIKIISTSTEFLSKSLGNIVECFKYQYRRLQYVKKKKLGCNLYLGLPDYINLISLAWYNVPDLYIKQIFTPPVESSLYFRPLDTCNGNHSLLQWLQWSDSYNIPLDLESYAHCLDEYIFCDKDLKSIDYEDRTGASELNTHAQTISGMEAYQAMKRLLSYVQGQRASEHVLQSAKLLENHLEYGALLEIHGIIAKSSSE